MSFVKRDVKDRVVQFPHRYDFVKVEGYENRYDLVPATGTVTEEGTAINKAYLQPIEDNLERIDSEPKFEKTLIRTLTLTSINTLSVAIPDDLRGHSSIIIQMTGNMSIENTYTSTQPFKMCVGEGSRLTLVELSIPSGVTFNFPNVDHRFMFNYVYSYHEAVVGSPRFAGQYRASSGVYTSPLDAITLDYSAGKFSGSMNLTVKLYGVNFV